MGSVHVRATLLPIHVLVAMMLALLIINSIYLQFVALVHKCQLGHTAVGGSGALAGAALVLLLHPGNASIPLVCIG